jgi:hypothetical protein
VTAEHRASKGSSTARWIRRKLPLTHLQSGHTLESEYRLETKPYLATKWQRGCINPHCASADRRFPTPPPGANPRDSEAKPPQKDGGEE